MLHQHADFHYAQTLQPGNTHRTGPCASPATQVTLLPSPTTCQTQAKPKDEAQDTNSVLKEPTACQAQCQPQRILRTGLGSACRLQPAAWQQPWASSPASPPTQARRDLAQSGPTHVYLQPRPPPSAPGLQTRGSLDNTQMSSRCLSLTPSKTLLLTSPGQAELPRSPRLHFPAQATDCGISNATQRTAGPHTSQRHSPPAPTCRGTDFDPSPHEDRALQVGIWLTAAAS